MLGEPGFAIGEVGYVTLKVAMLIAFGDAGALHDFAGALSMPHSHAMATLPAPSLRGTSFQPVPLQKTQFSLAIS